MPSLTRRRAMALRLLSKAAIPATAASSKLMSRPVAPGAGPLSMRSQHQFSHDHGDNDQGREANDGCRKHIPFGRIHLLAPEKGGLLRCARSSERLDKVCEPANNSAEFFYRVRRAVVRNLYSITELMSGEDKEDRAAA